MKFKQKIRKFFGVEPAIGDEVSGGLDFNVCYQGTLREKSVFAVVYGTVSVLSDRG